MVDFIWGLLFRNGFLVFGCVSFFYNFDGAELTMELYSMARMKYNTIITQYNLTLGGSEQGDIDQDRPKEKIWTKTRP